MWDAATGQQCFALPDRSGAGADAVATRVAWFAWSPDGRSLATYPGSALPNYPQRGAVHLWDAATGKERGSFGLAGTSGVVQVEWSPDGRRLLTRDPTTIKVWDADRGEEQFSLSIAPDPAAKDSRVFIVPDIYFRCGWAPDGKRLAVLTCKGLSDCSGMRVTFFDAENGKPQGPPVDVQGRLVWKWSPDGRRLALIDQLQGRFGPWGPYSATVLDTTAGRMLYHLQAPVAESVAWSSDSRRLLLRRPDEADPLAYDADTGQATAARPGDGPVVDGGGPVGLADGVG